MQKMQYFYKVDGGFTCGPFETTDEVVASIRTFAYISEEMQDSIRAYFEEVKKGNFVCHLWARNTTYFWVEEKESTT